MSRARRRGASPLPLMEVEFRQVLAAAVIKEVQPIGGRFFTPASA